MVPPTPKLIPASASCAANRNLKSLSLCIITTSFRLRICGRLVAAVINYLDGFAAMSRALSIEMGEFHSCLIQVEPYIGSHCSILRSSTLFISKISTSIMLDGQ